MGEDRRRTIGRRGEQIAVRHLRSRGYEVLARNARTRRGEIDLVARDRDALVFVEVKTRCVGAQQASPREDQLPLLGLDARQRARLRGLALEWLSERTGTRRGARRIRFDAVGVVIDAHGRLRQLEHIEDAW